MSTDGSLVDCFLREPRLHDCFVHLIKEGKFDLQKLPEIIVEILDVELVGSAYLVTVSDILGTNPEVWSELRDKQAPMFNAMRLSNDSLRAKMIAQQKLECSFHPDCKDAMKKVRKGRLLKLCGPVVFKVGGPKSEASLIVMPHCIQEIYW